MHTKKCATPGKRAVGQPEAMTREESGMRRTNTVLSAVGILAFATSAMAIGFTDSFEYTGTSDPNYTSNWSAIGGDSRYDIVTRIENPPDVLGGALDGTRVAHAANGGGYGMSRSLGGAVEPTNANPLVVEASYHHMAGNQRGNASFYLELSQGDVHAPAYSSTPLADPIPVIAIASGSGLPDKQWRFFNGQSWSGFPASVVAGKKNWNWNFITMTLTDNAGGGKDLNLHIENNDSNPSFQVVGDKYFYLEMWPSAFTTGETFDTVSVRALTGASQESMVDRVAVTPEPATVALLGFGCLWLARRRRL